MQATEKTSLVIGRFQVENFMRVKAFAVDAQGKHVVLSGPNGSGKSSVLDALWLTLKAKAKTVAEPIHHGAEQAHTRLELLDAETRTVRYVVERFWTPGETRLLVRGGDGQRFNRAQELLDGIFDEYSLDLSQFLRAKPREQVTAVLKVGNVAPPVAEIQEITGERIDPRPGEDAFALVERVNSDNGGIFYDRRKQLAVTLKQKQAALAEAQKALPIGTQHNGDNAGETAEDLLARIEELDKARIVRVNAQGAARQMRERVKRGQEKHVDLTKAVGSKEQDAIEAHRRWNALKEECQRMRDEAAKVATDLDSFLPKVEQAERHAAALEDTTPRINQLREQLRHVEEHRKAVAGREAAIANLQKLDQEVQDLRAQHARADLIVSRLRELPKTILERIDLGVAGLSVDGGELRLNGVPLAQGSKAERVRLACALLFKGNPDLKVVRIDDAEMLDSESWEIVEQEADRYGWQLFAGFVRDGAELGVELIESGK